MIKAAHSGVLVICTVRNVEHQIRKNIVRLRKSLKSFQRQAWIVVESDSSDGTLRELEKISRDYIDFRYITLGNLQNRIPERTIRIAKSRNAAFSLMHNYPSEDFSYVLLADLDGRNLDISESAILSCFDLEGWDMCAANQLGPYYDIWGLRHITWSPNDCWKNYDDLSEVFGEVSARKIAIESKMIFIHPKSRPIEVQSAFGGLALYRREILDGHKYSEKLVDGREICDHVDLNLKLSNLGHRLLINPKMINRVNFPTIRNLLHMPRQSARWFAQACQIKRKIWLERVNWRPHEKI